MPTTTTPPPTPPPQKQTAIILDALPYSDPPVPEDYEEYALSIIQAEMKAQAQPSPTSTAAAATATALPDIRFRTPLMQSEYELRQQNNNNNNSNSNNNILLLDFLAENNNNNSITPPSAAAAASNNNNNNNMEQWKDTVKRARIAYEKERTRAILLQVEKDNADLVAQQWKEHNDRFLTSALQQQQLRLDNQRQTVQDINLRRQEHQQQQAGKKLHVLETQYQQLIQKHYQLHQAIGDMEQELNIASAASAAAATK